MRLNKTQLATKLGCSERALSIWQEEGLPVLERGRRGQPNTYDLAAVIGWLKLTGRGISRVPYNRPRIDIAALERELDQSPAALRAAEGAFNHLAAFAVVPMAARLCARRGVTADQALEDLQDFFDVAWNCLVDRYGTTEFADGHELFLDPVYDEEHAGRQQLVDSIYKAAALERENFAPEIELGAPAPGGVVDTCEQPAEKAAGAGQGLDK